MTKQQIFDQQAKTRIWDYNNRISILFNGIADEFDNNNRVYTDKFAEKQKKAFLNIDAYTTRRNLIYSIMIHNCTN